MEIGTCIASHKTNKYILMYCYMYTFRSKGEMTIEEEEYIHLVSYMKYKDMYYLTVWNEKEGGTVDIKSKSGDSIEYHESLIRNEDPYVFNKNPNKFQDIKSVMDLQYKDLIFSTYNDPNVHMISSVLLNVILSQKIEYNKYFSKHGLMHPIKIVHMREAVEMNRKQRNYYMFKAPFGSASYCVTGTPQKLSDICYLGEGFIAQKKESEVQFMEMKYHAYKGKVLGGNIKSFEDGFKTDHKGNRMSITDQFRIVHFIEKTDTVEKMQKIIDDNKVEIKKLLKKAYKAMSELTIIIKEKLEFERKKLIPDLGLDEKVFYSIFNRTKLKILRKMLAVEKDKDKENKIRLYIKLIKSDPDEIKKLLKIDVSEEKYIDKYMRIDIVVIKGRPYVMEIEPFACGKGRLAAIQFEGTGMEYFDKINDIEVRYGSTNVLFTKYILNCENDGLLTWEPM